MTSSSLILRIVFCLTIAVSHTSMADPAKPTPAPDKPENKVGPESEQSLKPSPLVKKLSDGHYRIGEITFHSKTREITLSAETNIVDPDSILEFLLVHRDGQKIHESLLITNADPAHLNIALKLLRYKTSNELFRVKNADGSLGEQYHQVDEATRKAARFSIHITANVNGENKTFPANHWIFHRVLKKPMPDKPWVYNGSYVHQKKYKAKLTGNFIAIFEDYGSIANYSGAGRHDDTLWFPSQRVPQEGTKVTVTIKPWK